MNKLLKVIFAASAVVAASASAQTMTEYMAKKPYSGYLQTQRDVIVRERYRPLLAYRILDSG